MEADRRAQLTYGRDYCRGCGRETRQAFAGFATSDGYENGDRPRAFYRQCDTCGSQRLVLGNVTDSEGLCRTVLKKWISAKTTGAKVTRTRLPFGDGAIDVEDALGFLQDEVWRIYLTWNPGLSGNSFLAYASEVLPKRLASWCRDASGEVETRSGGRRWPKAHAASVSVSLDGLTDSDDSRDGDESGHGFIAGDSVGGRDPSDETAGPLALLRSLAAGSGGRARGDRGACDAAPVGAEGTNPAG